MKNCAAFGPAKTALMPLSAQQFRAWWHGSGHQAVGEARSRAQESRYVGCYSLPAMELRRLIHLAVLVGAVLGVHNFGPVELQIPVDQYVVKPVLRTSAYVQRELASGVALVSALSSRLGGGTAPQTE